MYSADEVSSLRDRLIKEGAGKPEIVKRMAWACVGWQTTARWQLGVCADQGAYKRDKINFDHLDKLLDELRESREDYYFDYDFTTQPWTLNFRALQGSVEAEMRPTRNLTDASLRRLPKFSERLSSAQKKADKADEEAAETQRQLEAMNQEITTLRDGMAQTRAYSSPKLLATNIFYLYVGTDAPSAATQHNIVWIKPGSAADADGTIPCEVKYIP